jgi:hypothetical protein
MRGMDRAAQIRDLLARRDREGLTLAALSRESGIPTGTLGYWAWKLRQEPKHAREVSPAARPRAEYASVVFVEVLAKGEARSEVPGVAIEVLLADGRHLAVQPGFDADHLVRLVRALDQC